MSLLPRRKPIPHPSVLECERIRRRPAQKGAQSVVNANPTGLIRVAAREKSLPGSQYLDDGDALQSSDPARRLLVPVVSQAQLPVAVVAPAVDLQTVEVSVNHVFSCGLWKFKHKCKLQQFSSTEMKGKTLTQHNNKVSHYFSIVQNGHRAELTAGNVDHHFVLQATADPTGRWLVGSRPRTHLARVVVAPCKHLNAAEKQVQPSRHKQGPTEAPLDS